MTSNEYICPKCGSEMKQTGSDSRNVSYHCSCCGHNLLVSMDVESNSEYWHRRAELLLRVKVGVVEWKTTPWDYLRRDIVDFVARNEKAAADLSFKMAIIACVTKGFSNMTAEKYKECGAIFKITEKAYKSYTKSGGTKKVFEQDDDVKSYEEYRQLYKRCRNEYRNTKLLWKGVFFVAKKVFMMPF